MTTTTKVRKLTPKQMALMGIVDAMRADIANGAEYLAQHPQTHEDLPARTIEAVERHAHAIVDALNNRLPEWARR